MGFVALFQRGSFRTMGVVSLQLVAEAASLGADRAGIRKTHVARYDQTPGVFS